MPEGLPQAEGLLPAEWLPGAESAWSVPRPEGALEVSVLPPEVASDASALLPGVVVWDVPVRPQAAASVELVRLPGAEVSDARGLPPEAQEVRAAPAVVQPSAALPWALLSSCRRDLVQVAPAQ